MKLLALAQLWLAARVLARLLARGRRLPLGLPPLERVSIILPVLDEESRLAGCLETLLDQGPEVTQVLAVDGGSRDRTWEMAAGYAARDPRLRLVDASPVPEGWNGKAWGLQAGAEAAAPDGSWLLTVDADTRLGAGAAGKLAAAAERLGLDALSVAARQDTPSPGLAALHPALLTTLVYRLGTPGRTFTRPWQVQANGQCFLVRRQALRAVGGFASVRASLCEDVTLARELVAAGFRVGFEEAGELVRVRMYETWGEAWRGWPRSLPLRDRFWGWRGRLGLLEVLLVQALPLPLTLVLATGRRPRGTGGKALLALNLSLLGLRLGVLAGTRRAYARTRWTYWLSPLLDLPAAASLGLSLIRRRHLWRGRPMVSREG